MARPNFFTTMKNFALQQPSEEWMILEFSQLGFIGEAPTQQEPPLVCAVPLTASSLQGRCSSLQTCRSSWSSC